MSDRALSRQTRLGADSEALCYACLLVFLGKSIADGRPHADSERSPRHRQAGFAAAEPNSGIDGLWLQWPYPDLRTAVQHRLDHELPPIANQAAWLGLQLWSSVFSADFNAISVAEAMAKVAPTRPVWGLAGSLDWLLGNIFLRS